MPIRRTHNKHGDPVDEYCAPCGGGFYDWSERGLAVLRAYRRDMEIEVAATAALQRALGRSPFARDAKELLRFWQRQAKGTGMVIDWISGKFMDLRFNNWPLELVSEFDEAFNRYHLATV